MPNLEKEFSQSPEREEPQTPYVGSLREKLVWMAALTGVVVLALTLGDVARDQSGDIKSSLSADAEVLISDFSEIIGGGTQGGALPHNMFDGLSIATVRLGDGTECDFMYEAVGRLVFPNEGIVASTGTCPSE